MAAIIVKEEKPDLEELNAIPTQKNRHGDKTIVEKKTVAALKIKQKINYRLKDSWPQQRFTPPTTTSTTTKKCINGGLTTGGLEDCLRTGCTQPKQSHETETPNSKCGEIFVTSNAKKWTFVCTYCQKSTRDIGEFVCHIKFKHMADSQYDDDNNDEGNENNSNEQKDQMMFNSTAEDCYNQGQDYFDCGNYLDVNVYTEDSDELSYKSQIKEPKTENIKKINDVVSLLDDDEDEGNNVAMVFDYDFEGEVIEDDEDGIQIIDDVDHSSDQRMEDDSKDLLLRRASIDEESNIDDLSGISTKKYRSHVRGTAYCDLCDKTFQYYSLYRNHMIKHSNLTPYKCQFCQKGFKSKQAIRYHMKTHSKEKQFQCPLCPTTYATSSLFMTHVLSHESDTCYPCMVCAKVLKTELEREEHVETHSEERPYSCSFCNKRFRQKHHLSNHLKLHCQYRCDFCRESFTSTQTQRRPYACEKCETLPEIRQQVERQRSLSLKPADVPPMKFENVMIESTNGTGTECVNLDEMASDAESEGSTSLLVSTNSNKHPQCNYCLKTFTHTSALNFHLRQKHSHH